MINKVIVQADGDSIDTERKIYIPEEYMNHIFTFSMFQDSGLEIPIPLAGELEIQISDDGINYGTIPHGNITNFAHYDRPNMIGHIEGIKLKGTGLAIGGFLVIHIRSF